MSALPIIGLVLFKIVQLPPEASYQSLFGVGMYGQAPFFPLTSLTLFAIFLR